MTRIFSNSMAAHIWAQQSQPEGQNGKKSLFFEGPTLFSYGRHYIAGYCLHMPDGGRVYMVNGDSNSVTTNRHVSLARQSAPGRCLSVPGLTDWAETLNAALTVYNWKEATRQEEAGIWPAWLPCGRVLKSAAERRAYIPELRARFERYPFPGEEAAAAMFRALGESNPEKAAAIQARKAARREELAAAERDKRRRDTLARGAKHDAKKSPRDIQKGITERLARHHVAERGIQDVAAWGRVFLAEQKEAKARGWTRIVATLKEHRKAIRAAVVNGEKRAGAAYRNRGKLRAVERFRNAEGAARRFEEARAKGVEVHTLGSPVGLARMYGELSAACADLSRHVALPESTLARLAELQDKARAGETQWQEEARRIAYMEEEEARAAWIAGGHMARRLSDKRGGALLRAEGVERDDSGAITGGELVTSHGASVPLAHALRVFRFLKHCRVTGQSWQKNGRALRVGHFAVDSVTPEGDFVAGCHRINWEEVERLARELRVIGLSPEDTTAPAAAVA